MFRQNRISHENAGGVEPAFGNNALALAEQIRQHAGETHINLMRQIGNLKAHIEPVALHAAFADKPAHAQGNTSGHLLFGQFAGRTEKHNIVFQRGKRQSCRQCKKPKSCKYHRRARVFG